jgi:hypothetical protein
MVAVQGPDFWPTPYTIKIKVIIIKVQTLVTCRHFLDGRGWGNFGAES